MSPLAPRLLPAALLAALAASPPGAQTTVARADVVAQLTTTRTATDFALASEAGPLQALADRTGPGQTWDLRPFSWATGTTATSSPATPPVPGSDIEGLDAATHVVAYAEGDSTAYGFVRVTDTASDLLGVTAEVEDEDSGGTVVAGLLFRPFDRTLPLPLTASSAWVSAYDLEFVPALGFLETETTDSSAVVGWGTLMTPAGSAAVLQVRTKTVSVATFTVPDQPTMTERDSSFTVEFVSRAGAVATLFLDGEGRVEDASYTAFGSGPTAGEGSPAGGALSVRVASANPVRRGAPVEVAFTLPEPSGARLDVFDALGRRVASRDEGASAPGERRTLVPTADLPAGVYVVRLAAGADAGAARFTVVE